MLILWIFALLAGSAYSSNICKDGQEMKTRLLPTAKLLVGNWSYVYHWDHNDKYDFEFINDGEDHVLECPQIEIRPVKRALIEKRRRKCSKDDIPFKWEDALLTINAPLINLKDLIIVIGKTEHWLFIDCKQILRAAAFEVTDDVVVMINPDHSVYVEMISRKPLQMSELKCIAHNVGVGKGMNGISLCN